MPEIGQPHKQSLSLWQKMSQSPPLDRYATTHHHRHGPYWPYAEHELYGLYEQLVAQAWYGPPSWESEHASHVMLAVWHGLTSDCAVVRL